METEKQNWGVNEKLQTQLEKLVKKIIVEESREDAMDILTKCTDKTVREFLHFALLEDYNLACTCLDFAFDKNTGEQLKNKSFGNWLDELKESSNESFGGWIEDTSAWIDEYIEFPLDEKDEELLIELEEWDHNCGDGCCYTYGVDIYVNGEKIENEDGSSNHQLLTAVLNKLGYTNVIVQSK